MIMMTIMSMMFITKHRRHLRLRSEGLAAFEDLLRGSSDEDAPLLFPRRDEKEDSGCGLLQRPSISMTASRFSRSSRHS
jgi:hypothetical protein